MGSDITLPADLEERCIRQFDELAGRKELLYAPSIPEYFTNDGFDFEVRITPIQKEKPITAPDDPGRTKASGGPFINPKPSEVVMNVGSAHRILLNKFSVYRPMLVLPTVEYEKQSDPLNRSDIEAAWVMLHAFHSDQMMIYNCGVNAGSSQGHKHMQVLPIPDPMEFTLWPSKARSDVESTSNIPGVPFKHFVHRIPSAATLEAVFELYEQLLGKTLAALESAGQVPDHNVILTKEWIALIPRSGGDWGGPFGANALGMLGLIAVRDEKERDRWAELGWTVYLRELGLPTDS